MSQKKAVQEIQQLLSLLELERQEEVNRFTNLLKNTKLTDRKAQGISWYPIVVKQEEIGLAEQWVLDIERTTNLDEPHRFNQGQTVELFSNIHEKNPPRLQGVLAKVQRNTLRLIVQTEHLPDWLNDGKLGINLLYNETTFAEMRKTLQQLLQAKNDRLADIRQTLLGYEKPSFHPTKHPIRIPQLNDSQNDALNLINRAEDIAIIHGPPGTGKTTTLIRAIQHTLKSEKQVLVCAPSNAAVDLLTQKLCTLGIRTVRVGHPARVNPHLQQYTLDAQISQHADYKQMKQLRKDAQQQRRKALKFKRNFGTAEREERRSLLKEARQLLDYAKNLERYVLQNVLENAQVVTATLVGSANRVLGSKTFSTVFIDEAAQALAPSTWIPITKSNRVIFAGDHCQLPPTVKSIKAQKQGLMISLFETCMQRLAASQILKMQYRMNDKIMQFSNQTFYNNKLKSHQSVQNAVLGHNNLLGTAVDFIDTAGCGFEEKTNDKTKSLCNPQEGELLLKYLSMIAEQLDNQATIGIIAPYKAQVNWLQNHLANYPILADKKQLISINTVDGFQGQERNIIGISMVRSNENGQIGFLSDTRRMNVAMTRAKQKLVMVGDSATLANHTFYQQLLNYIEQINAYKSAWEFMY